MTPHNLHTVFLGIGTNLGDRWAYLQAAWGALQAAPSVWHLEASPVYETRAHTRTPEDVQPDYLNAVFRFETTLSPPDVLALALAIEKQSGRTREKRWAARTLDVDVLLYDHQVWQDARLQIPHPRMGERRFVLKPLFDLAPDYPVPLPFARNVRQLLADCTDPHPIANTTYAFC